METMSAQLLPLSTEVGSLQIMHLKRYWQRSMLIRMGKKHDELAGEWEWDTTLLSVLGLGLEQTIMYLYQMAPTFEQFEQWIIDTAGMPDAVKVEKFNRIFAEQPPVKSTAVFNVLDTEQLNCWEENGYLIVRNAISKEDCEKTIETICKFIQIDEQDPTTWYNQHAARQGIMVQLFQDPVLDKNRRSDKIRSAYEEFWNRTDLWVNADRVGFNPPETDTWKFPGPPLHWDTEVVLPIPFGLQGLLYLTDTAEDQGAFTVVPGFHNRIDDWIRSLPPGSNPARQDLYALGTKPIAANAGDFIIWHQALPHGSSPNTSAKPRFVQYINYAPANTKE